jgi:hypothetical protein
MPSMKSNDQPMMQSHQIYFKIGSTLTAMGETQTLEVKHKPPHYEVKRE